jgi:hypothetical protein
MSHLPPLRVTLLDAFLTPVLVLTFGRKSLERLVEGARASSTF